jgi:hypothetical protein
MSRFIQILILLLRIIVTDLSPPIFWLLNIFISDTGYNIFQNRPKVLTPKGTHCQILTNSCTCPSECFESIALHTPVARANGGALCNYCDGRIQ